MLCGCPKKPKSPTCSPLLEGKGLSPAVAFGCYRGRVVAASPEMQRIAADSLSAGAAHRSPWICWNQVALPVYEFRHLGLLSVGAELGS